MQYLLYIFDAQLAIDTFDVNLHLIKGVWYAYMYMYFATTLHPLAG